MDKNITKEQLTQMYLTLKKESEEKIKKLELSEKVAQNRAKNYQDGMDEAVGALASKLREDQAVISQQNENNEKTVIRKKVLVEKLKTGFVTKEFTGELRSIKGNRQGGLDLMTDVAGDYLANEADVIEQVIQSTHNLLTRDGSGAKIVVDVTVIRIV